MATAGARITSEDAVQMSEFARTVYKNKYAQQVNGRKEEWPETADRLTENVVKPYLPDLAPRIQAAITARKFVPGGRYLYAAGKKYPQVNNCVAGDTAVLTDKGICDLETLANASKPFRILNRFGEWESARAYWFGEQELLRVTFSNGAVVRATPDHRWWQRDGTRTTTEKLACALLAPCLCPHAVSLDVEVTSIKQVGIEPVYCCVVPGSESFTLANGLVTSNCFLFRAEDSKEGWGDLMQKITVSLMTGGGIGVVYSNLRPEGSDVKGLGGQSTGPLALMRMVNEAGRFIMQGGSRRSAIWAGLHWSHPDVFRFIHVKDWPSVYKRAKKKDFNFPAPMDGTNVSVILDDQFFAAYEDKTHPLYNRACDVYWEGVRNMLRTGEPGFSVDVGENEGENLRNAPVHGDTLILTSYGYRRAADLASNLATVWTGKQWAEGVVFKKTGANVPVVRVRMSHGRDIVCDPSHPFLVAEPDLESGHILHRRGGFSLYGPCYARRVPAGELKEGDKLLSHPPTHVKVLSVEPAGNADVYCADVGVEEHSFCAEDVLVSNCTEVTSKDDSDLCNLSSINMARIESPSEFAEIAELGIAFLLCGTLYSKLPLDHMYRVRERNRRLGLGLMGIHEWLLMRGYRYGPCEELGEWLKSYVLSGAFANRYADRLGLSRPVATRSIAPTGTISIIAETTSGIEPIFATAYKRRYLDGKIWKAQYVVDATARRLIERGVDPDLIEDSLGLAEDVERRMNFQAWLQERVDHGISSTIGMPPWGSTLNNESNVTSFGNTLLKYLPRLRGITAFPDGARDGQPLTKVSYREACSREGVEFEDNSEAGCKGGVCGT